MTAQDREGRAPGAAEVWGLARVEAKAPVVADKADGPDAVAAAERAVGKGKVAPDVEVTGKTDFKVS